MARMIVDTVKAAGAKSPETALSTSELESAHRGFAKAAKLLLKKYSPLRRYVKSTTDTEDLELDTIGADSKHGTSDIDKKNAKKTHNESFSHSARQLKGDEKWYIPPYRPAEDGEEATAVSVAKTPYLLRDGAEPKISGVIVGGVLLIVFGEVIIHFLPQIMNFFVSLAEISKK